VAKDEVNLTLTPIIPIIMGGCPYVLVELTLKHERGKLQLQHKHRNWYNKPLAPFSYQIKKTLDLLIGL